MFLALTINASFFDNTDLSKEFNSFKENSESYAKLEEVLKAIEAEGAAQKRMPPEDFIAHYKAKIKAAKADKNYQAKLAALKKRPTTYKYLGNFTTIQRSALASDFLNYFLVLREAFSVRI